MARHSKHSHKSYNKYGNRKKEFDGHKFDSKLELKRYKELKLLEKAGIITNLELKPKYTLQEGFSYKGEKFRPIVYTPDFRYEKNGKTVVEEVKGFPDTAYIIRKKLFLYANPDVDFVEIKE